MSILFQQSRLFYMFAGASCVLTIACNVIWYRAKFAVKKKGFRVGFFYGHFDDYPNLKKAIEVEVDPMERVRLELLLRQMKMIWILFPLAVAALVAAASIAVTS